MGILESPVLKVPIETSRASRVAPLPPGRRKGRELATFDDGDVLIRFQPLENGTLSGGPSHLESVHALGRSQTEVTDQGSPGQVAICGVNLAHLPAAGDQDGYARPDGVAVASGSREFHL